MGETGRNLRRFAKPRGECANAGRRAPARGNSPRSNSNANGEVLACCPRTATQHGVLRLLARRVRALENRVPCWGSGAGCVISVQQPTTRGNIAMRGAHLRRAGTVMRMGKSLRAARARQRGMARRTAQGCKRELSCVSRRKLHAFPFKNTYNIRRGSCRYTACGAWWGCARTGAAARHARK